MRTRARPLLELGDAAGCRASYRRRMPARASAPPTSSRVEVVAGGAAAFAGALVLLLHAASVPGFVAELLVGFVSVTDFAPMLGGLVLLVLGLVALRRGRRGIRRHRLAVARLETMRLRQQQRRPGGTGVSAGVAGSPHRVRTSR